MKAETLIIQKLLRTFKLIISFSGEVFARPPNPIFTLILGKRKRAQFGYEAQKRRKY
jgi:hypothetical protein